MSSAEVDSLLDRIDALKTENAALRALGADTVDGQGTDTVDGWARAYTLNDGRKMPALGFGTWGGKDDADILARAVKSAIGDVGFRALDCAECYGNEREIGVALKEVFDGGKVKRGDVFITSKVWNTNHAPEHVRAACETTLANLQVDKLDLYLVHWPVAFEHSGIDPISDRAPAGADGRVRMARVPLHETWAAMERLVDDGLVASIGVSNYSALLLTDLLSYARIPPAVNQVGLRPLRDTLTAI
jgi:diketogulonate reductase-like aldo/keto reductase